MGKRHWCIIRSCLVIVFLSFGFMTLNATAAEKVQYGGTITYLDLSPHLNPMSWDNADWNWKHAYDTGFYIEHLLMGDLQKGPRGSKLFDFTNSGSYLPPEVVRGELVESWKVNKKPLSVTFNLRKGIMWQEKPGVMKAREFVADDVVYSMTRLQNSKKAQPGYLDFIERWEIKDKHTLVMHMNRWHADWGYHVGWNLYTGVQAPEQEKAPGGPGKWENACGTGPYMLTEYKSGHSQIYTKNPNYWDTEIINGQKYKMPFTDRVILMLMKDMSSQLTALRTGKIDLMMTMQARQMKDVQSTTPELIWSRKLTPYATMIALRMDKKPFNDVRVRRALNMAMDRKALGDFYSGGEYEVVNYPYPVTSKNVYTPFEQLPPAAKDLFIYNPEKAKKLLSEAGYPNGFSFKMQYGGSNSELIDYFSMIAAMLEKIGVKMEIEVMDYPSSLSRMTKKVHAEGWFFGTDHGTPLAIIRKIALTGQTWNASMMSDPYIDDTWKRLVSDPDITQKQLDAELKKLGVYLIEQAPGIMLSGSYVYSAWWPWVKNYYGEVRVGAHCGAPILSRIWIDQELKKKMGY